jgi:Na+/H+ antiporter NhaC
MGLIFPDDREIVSAAVKVIKKCGMHFASAPLTRTTIRRRRNLMENANRRNFFFIHSFISCAIVGLSV